MPKEINDKLQFWVVTVEGNGLPYARSLRGFNDEKLMGRNENERSIRLNDQYRAEYVVDTQGEIKFVNVFDVHAHKYRKK